MLRDRKNTTLILCIDSSRQKIVTTHKNVDAVYDIVMSARRVTIVQIVDALGLGYGIVNMSMLSIYSARHLLCIKIPWKHVQF